MSRLRLSSREGGAFLRRGQKGEFNVQKINCPFCEVNYYFASVNGAKCLFSLLLPFGVTSQICPVPL